MRLAAPAPTVAVLFLQPACNMHCSFCVTEDGFDAMDPDLCRELLSELARGGTKTVTFGGGEPFLWRDNVVEAATFAKSLGLHVQVGTNATRLPVGFEQLDVIDRWVLPLESTDAAIHDALRGFRESHHPLLLARLQTLGEAGREVTLSTVLTRGNVAGLPELASWIRSYHGRYDNVHAWHLYRFLPLGRGGSVHRGELEISAESYAAACEEILAQGLPFRIYRRSDMYHSRTVEFYWQEQGAIRSGGATLAGQALDPTTGLSPRPAEPH